MPSEKLVDEVLDILEAPRETYRSAVVRAVEELRAALTAHRSSGEDHAEYLGQELGPFASGRVDSGRLAGILSVKDTLTPAAVEVVERAVHVLAQRADPDRDLHTVVVDPGEDLRDAVRDALAEVGVAFGVAKAAELAKSGAYDPEKHNQLFGRYPFRRWSASERGLAPPLVVHVDGADLQPAGLADFLDGSVKIVLLVRGEAAPAPLARVITPGVTVVQTRDPADLTRVADALGPALAAVFDEDAEEPVSFGHDPDGGPLPWDRLEVREELDDLQSRLEEGGWKSRRGSEDVAHLVALATSPAGVADTAGTPADTAGGAPDESGSVDRLAAWLLAQTELKE